MHHFMIMHIATLLIVAFFIFFAAQKADGFVSLFGYILGALLLLGAGAGEIDSGAAVFGRQIFGDAGGFLGVEKIRGIGLGGGSHEASFMRLALVRQGKSRN